MLAVIASCEVRSSEAIHEDKTGLLRQLVATQ